MLVIESLTTEIDSDSGLVRAVDALSLTIERGETFALVGESGCGKSMTALSILRLLPDAGRVVDPGRSVLESAVERRDNVVNILAIIGHTFGTLPGLHPDAGHVGDCLLYTSPSPRD